jgi:hypothetical protein
MANLDRPRGFEPKGEPLRANKYVAGSACYPGDAVAIASDGKVDPAAAGGKILGVALNYASADLEEVIVADHPDQLFYVQADETQVDAQSDIGNVCDIVATAGNSTYKVSRMELDSSDVNTTSGQLLILGIEDRPNNALGAQASVIVKINEHQFADSFAGV